MKYLVSFFKSIAKLTCVLLLFEAINIQNQKLQITRKSKEKYIDLGGGFDPVTHIKNVEVRTEESTAYFKKAAEYRKEETAILTKISWLKIWQFVLSLIVLIIISIFAQLFFPKMGRNISNEYYVTLAQVFPVLLIACYIEKPIIKNKYDFENKMRSFWRFTNQFNGISIVLFGEMLCLFAIATKQSHTWLLLVSTSSFVYIFKILIDNIRIREA